jgi:hypothetical protein
VLTLYVCESFEADAKIERGTANIFDEAFMNIASWDKARACRRRSPYPCHCRCAIH